MKKLWVLLALLTASTQGNAATESIVYATTFAGADAGAQINAADAYLGSSPGTIIYDAGSQMTASTAVVLSANHALVLDSPIAWTGTITLPNGSSGQSISCSALQTINYPTAASWINGVSVSGISIKECNAQGTITTSTLDTLATFTSSSNVTLRNNTLTDLALITTNPGSSYSSPNVGNNYSITNNFGTATNTSNSSTFIQTAYTNNATISGNNAQGYYFGISWWGGDSCVSGCGAGGNGALSNPRKAANLVIADNVIAAIQAGIWGSNGTGLTIHGNVVNQSAGGGGDVGIDLEGTWNSVVSSNVVGLSGGFANGDLTAFWFSTNNKWDSNTIYQSNAAYPLIATYNSTESPTGLGAQGPGLSEAFTNNDLSCLAASVCSMYLTSAESYIFNGGNWTNTALVANNLSQLDVEQVKLYFSVPAPYGIYLATYYLDGNYSHGVAKIVGNSISSSVAQSAGTRAIYAVGSDYNASQQTIISGNTTGGTNPFPVDIECDAQSSNSKGQFNDCVIINNVTANNNIVTSSAGNTTVIVHNSNNLQAGN